MHVTNWRVIDQLRKRRTGKEMPLSLDGSAANLIEQMAGSAPSENGLFSSPLHARSSRDEGVQAQSSFEP